MLLSTLTFDRLYPKTDYLPNADDYFQHAHGSGWGKEITKAIYGSPNTKPYYLGCSTGGRQGFKAVKTFLRTLMVRLLVLQPFHTTTQLHGAPNFLTSLVTTAQKHFY